MPSLNATVTLPLMVETQADEVKREIKSLYPDLVFRFETAVGAPGALVRIDLPEDEPEADVDRVRLLLLRQRVEIDLAALIDGR